MARLARLILVSLGVALAVWLIPASIHIVDWTADGPVRVALFAPLWQLWTALAVAALLAGVIHAGVGAPGLSDAWIAPLGLMWLWVIPYLPWIPDRAPALLVLAGPLRWAVVAMAAGGSIATFVPALSPVEGFAPPSGCRGGGRRSHSAWRSICSSASGRRRRSGRAPTSRTTS